MRHQASSALRQRGAGVLAIVLMLAFIAALATWHALRVQTADTRSAAHLPRAAQALAAAESGVEWAVMMLGQGRIDAACRASIASAHASLRDRVLRQGDDLRWRPTGQRAACTMADGAWQCACDDAALARLDDAESPGFALTWRASADSDAPATVQLQARGCARASANCLFGHGRDAREDGVATVSTLLGLWSALPTLPAAALTAGGDVDPGHDDVVLDAHDPAGPGLAVAAGGSWIDSPTAVVIGRDGSPSEAAIATQQAPLATAPIFESLFALDRSTHRAQPALVRVDCDPDDCGPGLSRAAQAHPGRILWVPGDLRLRTPMALGAVDAPVLLSIDGELQADAGFSLHGVLHLAGTQARWSGGVARIQGALVAEHALALSGPVAVVYDLAVLQRLQQRHGSLVRVPGTWRDRPTP